MQNIIRANKLLLIMLLICYFSSKQDITKTDDRETVI